MISVYKFKNAIQLIAVKTKVLGLTYREIAEESRIHASYFSRVMMGKANFSTDQLFRIGEKLKFQSDELDYFLVLGSFELAITSSEKNYFSEKIKRVQHEKLKISERLDSKKVEIHRSAAEELRFEIYYQDALTAEVHMWLTIDEYKINPSWIANQLKISQARLEKELLKLEKLNLLKRKQGKIIEVLSDLHLGEDSPISYRNHINWRLKAIQNLESGSAAEDSAELKSTDYHLSVAFSADRETKEELRALIQDFILEAKKKVGFCSKPTEVYHLMLDLF